MIESCLCLPCFNTKPSVEPKLAQLDAVHLGSAFHGGIRRSSSLMVLDLEDGGSSEDSPGSCVW